MVAHVKQQSSVTSLPVSSSSSSSNYFNASIIPLSFSPEQTNIKHGTQWFQAENQWTNLAQNGEASMARASVELPRFICISDHGGGVEWKDIGKRFDRLAFTRNGLEPVVKWSDFGFCIGEKTIKF